MQSASTGSSVPQVDQRLQTKVFLAGMSVSLADLVIFATLHRALVSETWTVCTSYVTDHHHLYHCYRPTSLVRRGMTDTRICSGGLISCSTLLTLQAIIKG